MRPFVVAIQFPAADDVRSESCTCSVVITYDYAPIFSGVTPFVTKADYSLCTLETTFPDTTAYSGFPMFKSPAALAGGLKAVGFDLINTASNHCMDSGASGLVQTLDVLDQNGLDHVGTYRTQAEHDATAASCSRRSTA